jgi:general stress protein 26
MPDEKLRKLDEIRNDPHVNLGYFKDRTKEWVSVSGRARIVEDRARSATGKAPKVGEVERVEMR